MTASSRGFYEHEDVDQDYLRVHHHVKSFTVIQYSPVGFEAHISMPSSTIMVGSGIIDDGGGELEGEVTAYLLDTSLKSSLENVQGRSSSSQAPVIGSLMLRAVVLDSLNDGGMSNILLLVTKLRCCTKD